ncbi:hypothetical protein N7G274_003694 [Stereocaulon virgatum]|uniref:Sulfate transporter n=1 Tax=Stereocaulon virgatum TaxID=373712 RepID=A0ABR4AIY8_9LECA
MPNSQHSGGGRARSGSHLGRMFGQGNSQSHSDPGDYAGQEGEDFAISGGLIRHRPESSPSRTSFSSAMNQKTPARSYFQHSVYESHHAPVDIARNTSQIVREDTAELASWALSDIASIRSEHSTTRHHTPSLAHHKSTSSFGGLSEHDDVNRKVSSESTRPEVIEEESEPTSSQSSRSSQKSLRHSALTDMIKNSPPTEDDSEDNDEDELFATQGVHPVTVGEGIISQPNERTPLLGKRTAYGSVKDLESLKASAVVPSSRLSIALRQCRDNTARVVRTVTNPKSWNTQDILNYGLRQPASFIPPVILGLLLNILDALSYGMILFPLGNPIFAGLGPDGISMFYVSCIVSQLTYSLGGSIFKGAIGSEMIEVVPFFHKMAFTILARVGKENPDAVIATTIMSYALSSVLTGLVFFAMGKCKLGSLIGFFPRHILIGCIGGVGWFLVATGLEVSARLDGNLNYNLATLKQLVRSDTLPLWIIPLVLAILLSIVKRWVKHALTDATYFLSIIAIFYFFVFAIPELTIEDLRLKGWIFEAPNAGEPFYHFYTLYKFRLIDWAALLSTVPAMLALTFFGILHVPINIPALGYSTGEDNLDVDRELTAHGISNALSGLCGSIQNYLVYTNTVLFINSGGNSRVAGVMLAAATFAVMLTGPTIIGYIPIMVVGALIFYLGISLLKEALVDTWGRVHRLEFLTIIIIVVTMGAWDFVIGILVGILLACVSYVLQTSQVSAIRGKLYGGDANSTVRRHPIQHRYLIDAGQQIYVMKLAGFLFFGTIVGVEKHIRALLEGSFGTRPIRFLILDLYNVDGVDYSAAETFQRVKRTLNLQGVQLVMCGVSMESEVGKSLCNVHLFDEGDGVECFQSLNSALEFCENELLKALYQQRDTEVETESSPAFLEIPQPEQKSSSLSPETTYNSPRRQHLHEVATTTLSEQNPAPRSKWQEYKQPLQLILQTFSTVSDKPEDFWYRIAPFFTREEHKAGTVLYHPGDKAKGFYLLESGLLKARYDYPQGKYSELIVAGTTCGELPFFSSTSRTSTTLAETDCVTWILDEERWRNLQQNQPDVAQELLKISLKLTSERMDAITKYMLLTSG